MVCNFFLSHAASTSDTGTFTGCKSYSEDLVALVVVKVWLHKHKCFGHTGRIFLQSLLTLLLHCVGYLESVMVTKQSTIVLHQETTVYHISAAADLEQS